MKRILSPSALLILLWFGTLGVSIAAIEYFVRGGRGDAAQRVIKHANRGRSQVEIAVIDWLEKRSAASWTMNDSPHPAFSPDVELAEVLKRSILFPPVLRQGEGLIKFEYPNTLLFCMDAAFYAGRAMGLTWMMDRPALH